MSRVYSAAIPHRVLGADATQNLWSLYGATGSIIILHGWQITSNAIAAAVVACTLQRGSAVGSGGNDEAESPLNALYSAAVGTVRSGDTTQGTLGADLEAYQWEMLGPLGEVYIPEDRPVIRGTNGIVLTCETAVAFTLSGWVRWEEL